MLHGTFRSSSYTLSSMNKTQRTKEIRQIVKWSLFMRLKTMESLQTATEPHANAVAYGDDGGLVREVIAYGGSTVFVFS